MAIKKRILVDDKIVDDYLKKSDKKKKEVAKRMRKKSSADNINAERKRQGYKPLSAKDKRIFEGMDKYLP